MALSHFGDFGKVRKFSFWCNSIYAVLYFSGSAVAHLDWGKAVHFTRVCSAVIWLKPRRLHLNLITSCAVDVAKTARCFISVSIDWICCCLVECEEFVFEHFTMANTGVDVNMGAGPAGPPMTGLQMLRAHNARVGRGGGGVPGYPWPGPQVPSPQSPPLLYKG